MKVNIKNLKVGEKYFLPDYEENKIVEAILSSISVRNEKDCIFYMFELNDDNSDDFHCFHSRSVGGKIMVELDDYTGLFVELPVFKTKEAAEAAKDKLLLKKFKAIHKEIVNLMLENRKKMNEVIKKSA